MPEIYQQILAELIAEYELIGGLAALSDGTAEIARVGDFDSLENQALIAALIDDSETISRLNDSLENQILPRIWSQGKAYAYVMKPNKNVIVVIFAQDEKDAIAHYHHSQVLNSALNDKIREKTNKNF